MFSMFIIQVFSTIFNSFAKILLSFYGLFFLHFSKNKKRLFCLLDYDIIRNTAKMPQYYILALRIGSKEAPIVQREVKYNEQLSGIVHLEA